MGPISPDSTTVMLVATGNQVRIALIIEEILKERGVDVEYLTIDKIYDQTAGQTLQSSGRSFKTIDIPQLPTDWCSLDRAGREPFLEQVSLWAWSFFSNPHIGSLIVGYDAGDVEQICIRTAERFGVKTIRVQDGMQNLKKERGETSNRTPHIYPLIASEGGADLYLVWADFFKEEFEKLGLSGRVAVTGSPKHDDLYKTGNYSGRRDPEKFIIGLAGQPFAHYGDMWVAQELSVYEHIINMCLAREDVHVIFRPHPESSLINLYQETFSVFGDKITIDSELPLGEFLSKIDALVTITSSVSADASCLGIPTYALTYLRGNAEVELLEKYDRKFRNSLKSSTFPFSNYWIGSSDPKAHAEQRIGKAGENAREKIERALFEDFLDENSSTDRPSTTAVVISDGTDPIPTLLTIKRSLGSSDKVLFVDTSSDSSLAGFLDSIDAFSDIPSLRLPGKTRQEALMAVKEVVTTEFVLSIAAGAHLLPGSIERLSRKLAEGSGQGIVSSWFLGRSSSEAPEGVVEIPSEISLEDVQSYQSIAMLSYCFIAKKETLQMNGQHSVPELDLFLCSAFQQTPNNTVQVLQGPLFTTPVFFSNPEWNLLRFHEERYRNRFSKMNSVTSNTTHPEVSGASVDKNDIAKSFRNGDFKLTLEKITQLKGLGETDNEILYMKGLSEAKLEMESESRASLELLLQRDPENAEVKGILDYLKQKAG